MLFAVDEPTRDHLTEILGICVGLVEDLIDEVVPRDPEVHTEDGLGLVCRIRNVCHHRDLSSEPLPSIQRFPTSGGECLDPVLRYWLLRQSPILNRVPVADLLRELLLETLFLRIQLAIAFGKEVQEALVFRCCLLIICRRQRPERRGERRQLGAIDVMES